MVQIRISSSKLTLIKTYLVGNEGSNVPMKGGLKLPIVIKKPSKICFTLTKFHGD